MTKFLTGWLDHPPQNVWVTIGNFDGVHLGHRALIRGLRERAEMHRGQSLVLTFAPHPRVALGFVSEAFLLTAQNEKQRQLQDTGVNMVLTLPFDRNLAEMRAEAFMERLYQSLKPAGLLVGPQFRLGRNREGDFSFIQGFCADRGIICETFPPFQLGGEVVSSHRIRALLKEGRVIEAEELLGRPFSLEGEVRHGKHIGSKLGFPTANLIPEPLQLLPRYGVYATRVRLMDRVFMGVTNVGVRPTFESDAAPNVETLILDFGDKIYSETMRVEFLSFLRPEQRFEQVGELVAQIKKDETETRRIFQYGP